MLASKPPEIMGLPGMSAHAEWVPSRRRAAEGAHADASLGPIAPECAQAGSPSSAGLQVGSMAQVWPRRIGGSRRAGSASGDHPPGDARPLVQEAFASGITGRRLRPVYEGIGSLMRRAASYELDGRPPQGG